MTADTTFTDRSDADDAEFAEVLAAIEAAPAVCATCEAVGDSDVIVDALEALWRRAPGRRHEVEQAMGLLGYGLLCGEWMPRSEIRRTLAELAEEAEATR